MECVGDSNTGLLVELKLCFNLCEREGMSNVGCLEGKYLVEGDLHLMPVFILIGTPRVCFFGVGEFFIEREGDRKV